MRVFGLSLTRLWYIKWLRIPIIVIGIICLCFAIWFGLLMTQIPILQSALLRGGLIALLLGGIAFYYGIGFWRHRRASKNIEDSLTESPVGDGAILAERMQEALAQLKKSGGATYLYDLPWYVIIGPPGAGKTTALVHSGLEFPGKEKTSISGFGGTKNCDFWFTEEAILVDTAGRYLLHDSDERADRLSWQAFLNQLKRSRPNQPINGVLLAFSCEDMMTMNDEQLDSHALTIRERLTELQEALRIYVPVYVLFTKADKIAGFRDYFSAFGEERRRSVWGVTFQTSDRNQETYRDVPAEFDALISRLSNEVTDRLNEEPDSVARISIFGFPGQMALLQRNVNEFTRRIFQKSNDFRAILRGFYFTSGTQEGTPIDQVLGTMSATNQSGEGFQPDFMSGRARSYFLHDLLKKVVFVERDWVGYDLRAMRRKAFFRTTVASLVAAISIGAMGLFGYSFWNNASIVRKAQAGIDTYQHQAGAMLTQTTITDPNPLPVLQPLETVRNMRGGYTETTPRGFFERMGISIRESATKNYSNALERLLRPRMMLQMENDLSQMLAEKRLDRAYQTLKVYMILAKVPEARSDDAAISAYFSAAWQPYFAEFGSSDDFKRLQTHLDAMLELDERVSPAVAPNTALIARAQSEIAKLPLARQAYNSILSATASLSPLNLVQAMNALDPEQVLRVQDGAPLDTLEIPGAFTFTGYWLAFRPEYDAVESRFSEERWVLGEAGSKADFNSQMNGLRRDIHIFYQADFENAWQGILNRLELTPMSDGAPDYPSLALAALEDGSPIRKLAETVTRETRLSRYLDALEENDGQIDMSDPSGIAGQLFGIGFSEVRRRSGAIEGMALDLLTGGREGKDQSSLSGGKTVGQIQLEREQLRPLDQSFEKWHRMVLQDQSNRQLPIVAFLTTMRTLLDNRVSAARYPSATDAIGLQKALGDLNLGKQFYPQPMVGFINQIEREFLTEYTDKSLQDMKRALANEVTNYCESNIIHTFPFKKRASPMSTKAFGEFFGHGGRMQKYYLNYLKDHTDVVDGVLVPRQNSVIGERLSPAMLKQFMRAERIRDAFFDTQSSTPSVAFSIKFLNASIGVSQSRITFGDDRIATLYPGSSGPRFVWPDETSDLLIELTPSTNNLERPSRGFQGGRWAVVDLISKGQSSRNGNRVDVTIPIGGPSASFRLEFDSTTVPFMMPDLYQFRCPANLE